jgi:hypothetical protein
MNNILDNVTFVDIAAFLFALLILAYILVSEFFGHTVDTSWITIFLTLIGYLGIGNLAKQIPSAAQSKQIDAAMTVIGTLAPPPVITTSATGKHGLTASTKTYNSESTDPAAIMSGRVQPM